LTSWGNTEDVALLIAAASTKLQASIIRKCAAASAVKDLTEETFDKFVDLLELRPGKNATWIDWFDWGYVLDNEFARHDHSATAYRKAIQINPEYAYAWNNLGDLLQNQFARYDESEAAYREAIRIKPEDAVPWNGLGILLQDHLARYDESEVAYREAIRINPEYAYAWNNLGNLLADYLDRIEEATGCYRFAIKRDASLDAARLNLVFLLRDRLGESQKALELLNDLRRNPTPPITTARQDRENVTGLTESAGMRLRFRLGEPAQPLPVARGAVDLKGEEKHC